MNTHTLLISLLAFSIMLLATSCSTSKSSYSTKTLSVTSEIVQYPTVVDLKISSGKIEYIDIPEDHERRDPADELKNKTLAKALEANKADVLVEPKFKVTTTDNEITEVKVSGYPATYKNFRTATKEEVSIIKDFSSVQKVDAATTKEAEKAETPGTSGWAVVGAVVGVLVVILGVAGIIIKLSN